MKYEDLKIQFRAVPYGSDAHVLEYRADPDQDLSYDKEINIFGLIKFTVKRKHKTSWHRPIYFFNHLTAYLYSVNSDNNWFPFIMHSQEELDDFKKRYLTIGEFKDYQYKETQKNIEEWEPARVHYLEKTKILY